MLTQDNSMLVSKMIGIGGNIYQMKRVDELLDLYFK